jgi:hypothetical protein
VSWPEYQPGGYLNGFMPRASNRRAMYIAR